MASNTTNPEEIWFNYDRFDASRLKPKAYESKTITKTQNQQAAPTRGRGGGRGGQPQQAKVLNWYEQFFGYMYDITSLQPSGATSQTQVQGYVQFRCPEMNFYAGFKEETGDNGDTSAMLPVWLEFNNPEHQKIIALCNTMEQHGWDLLERNSKAFGMEGFKLNGQTNPELYKAYLARVQRLLLNPDDIPADKQKEKYKNKKQDGPSTAVRLKAAVMSPWRGRYTQIADSGNHGYKYTDLLGIGFRAIPIIRISHLYLPNGNQICFQVKLTGLVITGMITAQISQNGLLGSITAEVAQRDPEAAASVANGLRDAQAKRERGDENPDDEEHRQLPQIGGPVMQEGSAMARAAQARAAAQQRTQALPGVAAPPTLPGAGTPSTPEQMYAMMEQFKQMQSQYAATQGPPQINLNPLQLKAAIDQADAANQHAPGKHIYAIQQDGSAHVAYSNNNSHLSIPAHQQSQPQIAGQVTPGAPLNQQPGYNNTPQSQLQMPPQLQMPTQLQLPQGYAPQQGGFAGQAQPGAPLQLPVQFQQ